MLYRALADLVLLLHLGFILFAVLGGLLVLRRPWLAWFHLPVVIWAVLIEFVGWICPLTPLESRLRQASGGTGYESAFIEHYVTRIIYPSGLTPGIQWALGLLVVAINLGIYIHLWRSRRVK